MPGRSVGTKDDQPGKRTFFSASAHSSPREAKNLEFFVTLKFGRKGQEGKEGNGFMWARCHRPNPQDSCFD
jgi:hypothetical protein